jgi:hypothetical protein
MMDDEEQIDPIQVELEKMRKKNAPSTNDTPDDISNESRGDEEAPQEEVAEAANPVTGEMVDGLQGEIMADMPDGQTPEDKQKQILMVVIFFAACAIIGGVLGAMGASTEKMPTEAQAIIRFYDLENTPEQADQVMVLLQDAMTRTGASMSDVTDCLFGMEYKNDKSLYHDMEELGHLIAGCGFLAQMGEK